MVRPLGRGRGGDAAPRGGRRRGIGGTRLGGKGGEIGAEEGVRKGYEGRFNRAALPVRRGETRTARWLQRGEVEGGQWKCGGGCSEAAKGMQRSEGASMGIATEVESVMQWGIQCNCDGNSVGLKLGCSGSAGDR